MRHEDNLFLLCAAWAACGCVSMRFCRAEETADPPAPILQTATGLNDPNDGLRGKLARMPQPWKEKVHRVTRQQYEATLQHWAERHSAILSLERVGQSNEDVPIFLLKITDLSVPDADKQACLITALHGGPERSGPTTVLHLAEWLLGQAPDAVETRRRQIVLLMPIVNPYAYFVSDRFGNSAGIDPYTGGGPANWDLATLTHGSLEKAPEIGAFLSVVDRYQPEIHADIHGIGLQEYPGDKQADRRMYQGQTMIEVTGSAYSNYALRPWDWRVTEAMVSAGQQLGYGSDRFEADAQRGFWGPGMDPVADRLWRGRPNFYTAQYAYARYHTMLTALEVGWEESGVARLQGLLKLGNNVWPGERHAGYPVDRVKAFIGHYVTAWGQTAQQRRRSRVELWQRQGQFTQAVLYPQTDGRDTYIVALTEQAAALLADDKAEFLANIRDMPGIGAEEIAMFVNAGPEIKLAKDPSHRPTAADHRPVENGIGLRLRLPYRKPELIDVRVNGRLLEESASDGYQAWLADGFTQLQISIPPEKSKTTSLLVVTCAYIPDVKRSYGWKPPREVLERLEANVK